MKKTILGALSIVLMLFAFASCSNDSGKPGFTGDASDVAEALDPAKLVGDVLKPGTENVDVEYKLIQGGASSVAKATAGSATLQATVTLMAIRYRIQAMSSRMEHWSIHLREQFPQKASSQQIALLL